MEGFAIKALALIILAAVLLLAARADWRFRPRRDAAPLEYAETRAFDGWRSVTVERRIENDAVVRLRVAVSYEDYFAGDRESLVATLGYYADVASQNGLVAVAGMPEKHEAERNYIRYEWRKP